MNKAPSKKGLEELQKMFDESNFPSCIYHLNAGKIIAANQAYLSLMNFESNTIDSRVLKVLSSFIFPQSISALRELDEDFNASEINMSALDGRIIKQNALRIKKSDGNDTYVLEHLQPLEPNFDQVETGLKDKYHFLFEDMQDAYILLDLASMRIIDANQSAFQLYQTNTEAFVNKSFGGFLQSVQKNDVGPELFLSELKQTLLSEKKTSFICLAKTKGGFYFETTSKAMLVSEDDASTALIIQQNLGSNTNSGQKQRDFYPSTYAQEEKGISFKLNANRPYKVLDVANPLKSTFRKSNENQLFIKDFIEKEFHDAVREMFSRIKTDNSSKFSLVRTTFIQGSKNWALLKAWKDEPKGDQETISGIFIQLGALNGDQLAQSGLHELTNKSNPKYVFDTILSALTSSLNSSAAFIGTYDQAAQHMQFLAWKSDNENFHMEGLALARDNFSQDYAPIIIAENATKEYAHWRFLQDWKINAFAMYPLLSSNNEFLGVLGLLNQTKIEDIQKLKNAMNVFARRTAFELERRKQFSEIASAEKSFKTIFNRFHDIIIIQDKDYKIIDVNDSVVHRLGYRRDEVIGRTPVFLARPGFNDLDYVFKKFNKAFQGISQKVDFWWQTIQEETFPTEILMQRGVYFGQEVVVSIARDITERSAMEKALKASKDQYQVLFDGLYDAIFIVDVPSFDIQNCNEKAVELFGFNKKEGILKARFSDFVVDDKMKSKEAQLATLLASINMEDRPSSILKFKTKNGDYFDTEVTVFDFDNTNGNQVLVLVRNISEEVKAKLDLRRQHSFLRKVIDLNPNYIFAKDENLRFTLANQNMARLFNKTVDDLIGKTEQELMPESKYDLRLPQKEKEIFSEKKTVKVPLEVRLDANGVKHFLQTTKTIIAGEKADQNQLLGVSTDITNRILAEQALIESEQKIRDTQESAELGSWEVQFPGEKHWWSDQLYRIFGFSGGEIEPKEFIRTFVAIEEKERLEGLLSQLLRQKKAHFDVEAKMQNKNRELIYIRIKGKLELDEHTILSSMSGIIFDITDKVLIRQKEREIERLRAEDAINRAQKENLKTELEFSTREISSNLMMSSQQNQLLSLVKEELAKMQEDVQPALRKRLKNLVFKIQQNIHLNEDWEKFKFHFDKVKPDFFSEIKKNYPMLSQKDMKHCAYILMGLSAKDVASMLDVNPKSVDMARYRLKKKFKLSPEKSISEFLHAM